MPTEKNDRTTQWTLDQGDSTYILARKATISVSEGYGIYESTSSNTIIVLGDITLSSTATAGVRFMSGTSSLEIGKDSRIDAKAATYGVFAEGAGQPIVNRGEIRGGSAGIHGEIWGKVENHGTIKGEGIGIHYLGEGSEIVNHGEIDGNFGIVTGSAGTRIVNEQRATISGMVAGITLLGSGATTISNSGIIRSGNNAIQADQGPLTVVNTGKIIGNVTLSDGIDSFDTTRGVVEGVIRGGEGDDFYYISSSKTKLEDLGASFNDTVFSSASYRLVGGLDHLELRGKGDIDATGNRGGNMLAGNKGDNHISGLNGDDLLAGWYGDDVLRGGGGKDIFHFSHGGDTDRVKDFEDGVDWIRSDYVTTVSDFGGLKIKSVNGDLVVDFGHGDRMILGGIAKADFSIADFLLN